MDHLDERPELTPAEIETLKAKVNPHTGKNYTQADIAELYGVSKQYVSKVKHQITGFSQTPREVAMEAFPWIIGRPYDRAAVAQRLRDHAEYAATGGVGMSSLRLYRLRMFYQRLRRDDVVVEFHPSIPPGETRYGGFAFRPRVKSDGDLIIRLNDLAKVNEATPIVWRMPEVLPGGVE